ncbi:MAG: KamA family radical SAM protein [Myxococcota bacterium]
MLHLVDANEDWRWQARHALRTLEDLERHLRLTDDERTGILRAERGGFPVSITPHYLSLIDRDDPNCPIRRQVVPVASEADEVQGDLRDPLGEEAHSPAPELVRRYPDRVLLLATDRCAVYCRFCTRSRMVGDGGGARSLARLEEAFRYIEDDPTIRDVIVSGGDPLVMATSRVTGILQRLASIDHVLTVRVGTRAPVTIPQRIDDELARALRTHPAVWVMTHFNHPRELAPAALRALAILVDHGIPVMNQTVLLRGINDQASVLEALFRGLVAQRVRPYYLLQADPVRGTGHLRTPVQRGIDLMAALQGRLSGIALPKFIIDTPGGKGKVPVGPETIIARHGPRTTLRTFRGEIVEYIDPPSGK